MSPITINNLVGTMLSHVAALELETLSQRQRLFATEYLKQPRHHAPISLVVVDNQSLHSPLRNQLFGRTWESRQMYGYVTRFLNRSKPRYVLFDLSFNAGPDTTNPQGDAYFIESLQKHSRVGSSLLFTGDTTQSMEAWHTLSRTMQEALKKNTVTVKGLQTYPVFQKGFTWPTLNPPFLSLLNSPMNFFSASCTWLAFPPNSTKAFWPAIVDTTHVLRTWVPFSLYGPHVFASSPLGMVLDGQKHMTLANNGLLKWPTGQIHLGRTGLPLIKWYGHMGFNPPQKLYAETSFWDVVESELVLQCQENPRQTMCPLLPKQPKITPQQFNNQYVLINKTVEGAGDTHQTVFSNRYPGVYVLANILDNLLFNDFVYPAEWWQNALFLLGVSLVSLWVCMRFSPVLALACLIALGFFAFTQSYQFYKDHNLWLNVTHPMLSMVAIFTGQYGYRYMKEKKYREQIRYAFGKYVSPSVLGILEKSPTALQLGGQKREMTLLFCDIRGFTSFSEDNDPETVQHFLTDYFSVMNRIILNQTQGAINKLMGDAIMAYWGFPLDDQDHAFLAVSAALAMKEAMLEWQQNPDKPPLQIGIGIHTGEVMVGNVGSEEFMDFTVIGDAVNLAARLESLNKDYETTILISESTYQKVQDRVEARALGTAQVRGKTQAIAIFEPLALTEAKRPEILI